MLLDDETMRGNQRLQAVQDLAELTKMAKKIAMAVFASLTLLVPMSIMVLLPGVLRILAITTVFVLVIAIALAVFMRDAEPKDVVAASAGYAAVLVVFVGTSGSISEDADNPSDGVAGAGNSTNSQSGEAQLNTTEAAGIVVGCIAGALVFLAAVAAIWILLALTLPERIQLPIPGGTDTEETDGCKALGEGADQRTTFERG